MVRTENPQMILATKRKKFLKITSWCRYEEFAEYDSRIDFETPVTAKEFFKTAAPTILTEFDVLDRVTETRAHAQRLYQTPEIRPLNRYTDILTYQDTRVVLQPKGDDYINACFVDVSFFRKYS